MASTVVDGVIVTVEADSGGFKKSIEQVGKDLENFGEKGAKDIEKVGKAADDAGTEIDSNMGGTALSPVKNSMESFGAAGAAAMGLIGAGAASAAEEIAGIGDSIVGSIGDPAVAAEIKALAIELSQTLPFAVEEIAAVLVTLNQALNVTGEQLEDLATTVLEAARVLGIDAVAFTESLVMAIKNLGIDSVEQVEKLLDVMAALNQNMSNFDSLAFLEFLTDSAEALKRLNEEALVNTIAFMAALISVTGDASFAVDLLNKAFAEATLTGEDLNVVLARYGEIIQGAAQGTIPLEEAAALLGTTMAEMEQIVLAVNTEFAKFVDVINSASGTVDETTESMSSMTEQMQIFKNQLRIVTGILGLALLPILMAINAILGFFINLLTDASGNLSWFGKIVVLVASAWLAWKIIKPIIRGLSGVTKKLGKTVKKVGKQATKSGREQVKAMKATEKATDKATKSANRLGKAFKALGTIGFISFLFGGSGGDDSTSSSTNVSSGSGTSSNSISSMGASGMGAINNNVAIQSSLNVDGRVIANMVNEYNTKDSFYTEQVLDPNEQ